MEEGGVTQGTVNLPRISRWSTPISGGDVALSLPFILSLALSLT
jgi:hypothetical protein